MIPLIIHGLTGRMGRRIAALSAADPEKRTVVLAGIAASDDPHVGGKLDGIPVVDRFDKALCFATAGVDGKVVVVDFSTAAAVRDLSGLAADNGLPLVSGTTGLSGEDRSALESAARTVPVLWAPNMSLGVQVLERLVEHLATLLPEAEVEIEETHHRHKADAPSGTARLLAERVRAHRPGAEISSGRTGVHSGGRPAGEIAIQSLRMGEVVGDHAVHFALDHEIITVSHRALSRDVFAAGALAAARFVALAPPGLYGMRDVVGAP